MSEEKAHNNRWITPWEVVAVAVSLCCLWGSLMALERARIHADPRFAMIDRVRREAGARDLIVLSEESLQLAARADPIPVLWGSFSLQDLRGVRRLYALTASRNALFTWQARLGAGRALDAFTMAWDLGRTATVRVDITTEVGARLTARRVGGLHDGDCPLEAGGLNCRGDPWNHVRPEAHRFDGAELMCLYAHPQADGRLELSLANLPPMRALVGVAGIDDAGQHPGGAPVHMSMHFVPISGTMIDRRVVSTSDARGVVAYRVELPYQPGSVTLSITTPNAGARQFCFTLYGTE